MDQTAQTSVSFQVWLVLIPILCTAVMLIVGWLWKNSISKTIDTVDGHNKIIPVLQGEINLLKQDVSHFREREAALIKAFEDRLSSKIDHLDEVMKLRMESIERYLKGQHDDKN